MTTSLENNASIINSNLVLNTVGIANAFSYAWHPEKKRISSGFVTRFEYMGTFSSTGGFAFVFHNAPEGAYVSGQTTYIASPLVAYSPGFKGIKNSYAIAFQDGDGVYGSIVSCTKYAEANDNTAK